MVAIRALDSCRVEQIRGGNMDKQVKAVIFDFDYTLGDSTLGIIQSVNHGLISMGHSAVSDEQIRRTIGLSLSDTYKVLTHDENIESSRQFAVFFKEKADEVMVENTELFPDVAKTLQVLHNRGIRNGILTTKYHFRIDQILQKCEVTELFDEIVGGDDVAEPKPAPEGMFRILARMRISKADVLYVGDSLVDAKTAMQAGVDFVAVTTGTTAAEEFDQYPNVAVINNISELLDLI